MDNVYPPLVASRLGIAASRATSFVRTRPRTQQAAGVAAIALTATAPFGGFAPVAEAPAASFALGDTLEVGPFQVHLERAVRLPDLEPVVAPSDPGNQLIVLITTVRNIDDVPAFATYLSGAISIEGSEPALYFIEDGSRPSEMNPGLDEQLVMVVEAPSVEEGPVTVEVLETLFRGEGGLTLDENYWTTTDEIALSAELPLEERA